MLRWLLVGVLVLAAGCGTFPRKPLVGTWKTPDGSVVQSFNQDGTMRTGFGQRGTTTGHWKMTGDHLLEVQTDNGTPPDHTKWSVSDDGKSLTLTPQEGGPAITYLRQ